MHTHPTIVRSLERFKEAQDSFGAGYEAALAEIRSGGKRGHWIWYVFPQLSGLGTSHYARLYAIADIDEAIEYLSDQTLRHRLLTITVAVSEQLRAGTSITTLMGSPLDARKLVSSLTLFEAVARHLESTRGDEPYRALAQIIGNALDAVAAEGYPRCGHTTNEVDRWRSASH